MTNELPRGWARATIGDITESMKNGIYKPASSYADDGVACLRMYNIDGGVIVWRDVKRMNLTPQEVQDYQILPGDLLVNRVNSRELVGKSAVFPRGLESCVFESKNIRLRLRRDAVCPKFLNYKLLLSGSRHFIHNAQQVVGMASISQPQIATFEFALPPLPEQRRIVARLETIFTRVDDCQRRLAKVSVALKRFRQSVLASACSGRLTADLRDEGSEEWEEKTLGELLTAMEAGRSFVCEERPPRNNQEVGVLKVSAVSWGIFDENESKTCLDPKMVKKEYFVHQGDLLISRANTIELVGAVVIVAKLTKHVMLSDKTLRLRLKGVTPEWILYCLRSQSGRDQIESLATGNQQSMRNISQESIRAIRVPIPPAEEQTEIVRRVEALLNIADRIEARFVQARAQVDKLTPSLLAKAFRGELAEAQLAEAEGREFESAAQLFARIKSIPSPVS